MTGLVMRMSAALQTPYLSDTIQSTLKDSRKREKERLPHSTETPQYVGITESLTKLIL